MESEIRKDYFLDKYVIIAPKRAKKPEKTRKISDDLGGKCYFCPSDLSPEETIISEVKGDDGKWQILTIDNKFPALSLDNERAYGKQELIIETPKHNIEISDLPVEEIVQIFNVYIERFLSLSRIPGVRYVLVFKNEGGKAGASIPHAHSQIFALPLLPPEIKHEFMAYNDYKIEKDSCPYCDIIKKEQGKRRVIWEDEHLFVLAPFASQSPFGAWFLPKRHFRTIAEMTNAEKHSFAEAMKVVLGKLEDINVSYNYFFHNATESSDYHMHLELAPRPNVWAGLELGTGLIINPIAPEFAAKFYREGVKFEPVENHPNHIKTNV